MRQESKLAKIRVVPGTGSGPKPRGRVKHAEGGMLRLTVNDVNPNDMIALLNRCEGLKNRYVRSIKRDVQRWLAVRCPVGKKRDGASVSAKHASTLQTVEA